MNTMLRNAFALSLVAFAAHATAEDKVEKLSSFTVCADPGNMPLSNKKGEGFQNKIAEVLGEALGTGVQYSWRPSFERALMRNTINAGSCDLWMDMAADTDGAEMTSPLYRSTFVLVYRNDSGFVIKDFDDPNLDRLKVGVYQVSAIRQALAAHGIMQSTVIQYLSHDGDHVPENQPSYQVQQVIDKKLDVAGVWGPMAGYYKSIKKAPLVIQPVNLMEDNIPLEFDMAFATARGRPEVKGAIEKAMTTHGFARSVGTERPDVLIHYHANVMERLDVDQIDRGNGSCATTDCQPRVTRYEAGTLVVDIVDAASNVLIWRGWAQGSLDGVLGNRDRLRRRIDESVRQMFETLPPVR